MEIYSFKSLPSTQKYLLEKIKSGALEAPAAVIALEQNAGVGSRENTWSGGEGNFFASVALFIDALPKDLALSSASIYFSFIMKKVLNDLGEKVWLKWPNDFYLDQDKVGGTITQKVNNILICGIGINLKNNQYGFRALKSDVSAEKLLKLYLEALDKFPQWKHIFSEYQVEFERSREFSAYIENCKKSLAGATLCEDGSLILEGKRVFSLR
ncbi:MAG: biotin--[acetyl-CoA-carboxylase] ligase [Sulfurovum sp.]|nr:biotin--[acetyl-CoA-carboxylase] ligase [Sulfurovum sp.]